MAGKRMIKQQIKFALLAVAGSGIALFLLILRPVHAAALEEHPNLLPTPLTCPTNTCGTNQIPSVVRPPQPAIATNAIAVCTNNPGMLDERRQFALGMIETGNNDALVGGAGEVSRYQIMPSVWRHYSRSRSYENPEVSLAVARQHWVALHDFFKAQTRNEPTDFDMYVLWNTRYGYYASRGYKPSHLDPIVRDRARRFVNLVKIGGTEFASLAR